MNVFKFIKNFRFSWAGKSALFSSTRRVETQTTETVFGLRKRFLPVAVLTSSVGFVTFSKHQSEELEKQLPWKIHCVRYFPTRLLSRVFGACCAVPVPIWARTSVYKTYSRLSGADWSEASLPLKEYRSLQHFFTRSLKDGLRPIDPAASLVSPVDGRIAYIGPVSTSNSLHSTEHSLTVKNISYPLSHFFRLDASTSQASDTEIFENVASKEAAKSVVSRKNASPLLRPSPAQQYMCVIYLSPADYHHIHSPAAIRCLKTTHLAGDLFPVAPLVTRIFPSMVLNERVLLSGEWKHGSMALAMVGAFGVGSISLDYDRNFVSNHGRKSHRHARVLLEKAHTRPLPFAKGSRLGRFNLGSTVVLLFDGPPGANATVGVGAKVKMGQPLFEGL
eukprot:GCRY01002764.1.p1 GENE.GCRY01002764.1~~GCRY01002764.1.p1  ORF type:complete len:391 (+),score=64.98 GCRY01002764.1:139-1311(+)